MAGRGFNLVLDKAEKFALRIVCLCKFLQDNGERVMSKQMLRSGTSIGANIAEGHYAASKPDFINKYVIAQKEAAETLHWLNLPLKSEHLPDDDNTRSLIAEYDELIRLLVASIKTTKMNMSQSDFHNSSFLIPHS